MFGDETFTEHLVRELGKEAGKILISYGETVYAGSEKCEIVRDIYPGCGPIGGLHAGLLKSEREIVMTAACDMPFLKVELLRYLAGQLSASHDGVVPLVDGKIHPLAAVYRKRAAKMLEEQILAGDYKVMRALQRMNILYVEVGETESFRKMLQNVNTAAEYQKMAEELGRWQNY